MDSTRFLIMKLSGMIPDAPQIEHICPSISSTPSFKLPPPLQTTQTLTYELIISSGQD